MQTIETTKDAFRTFDIDASFKADHAIIKYQGTDIVTFDKNEIVLTSGGVRNKAIKSKINQAAEYHGLNYHVFQRGKNWLIETPEGKTILFKDGVKFKRVKKPLAAVKAERVKQIKKAPAVTDAQMKKIIEEVAKLVAG